MGPTLVSRYARHARDSTVSRKRTWETGSSRMHMRPCNPTVPVVMHSRFPVCYTGSMRESRSWHSNHGCETYAECRACLPARQWIRQPTILRDGLLQCVCFLFPLLYGSPFSRVSVMTSSTSSAHRRHEHQALQRRVERKDGHLRAGACRDARTECSV